MTQKLTPITPRIKGYCVVVVQQANADGSPDAFLGCLLQTPDSADAGPLLLLGEAIRKFKALAAEQESSNFARIPTAEIATI